MRRPVTTLDLLSMLVQLKVECGSQLDFIYLPGDVADNGQAEQYRLVAAALRLASVPVYAISGDYDMEPGSLAAFYAGLGAAQLPVALEVRGVRCLFLDVCGPGQDGPDFRLGATQLSLVPAGTEVALSMHTYPADLRDKAERAWEENGIMGTQLGSNRNAKLLHHPSSTSS